MIITTTNSDNMGAFRTTDIRWYQGEVMSSIVRGELQYLFCSQGDLEQLIDQLMRLRDEVDEYILKNDPKPGTDQEMPEAAIQDEQKKIDSLNQDYTRGGESIC